MYPFRTAPARTRPARPLRTPRVRRPALEPMESRVVLSTLVVDINDPAADRPGDHLYAQIQQAVDAASPGDTIRVRPGTYRPVAVAKDRLTIRADDARAVPVVDAAGGLYGIRVQGSGVTVRGLAATGAALDSDSENACGFLIEGDNNTIVGNTATANQVGFALFPGAEGNRLLHNTATDNEDGFVAYRAHNNTWRENVANANEWGFTLIESRGSRMQGNTASQNGGGFVADQAHDNTWQGNAAHANELGFTLSESHGSRLVGNTATENEVGFAAHQARNTTWRGNAANDNERGFFLIECRGGRLVGNTAHHNRGQGVLVYSSVGITLTANAASENGQYGFMLNRSETKAVNSRIRLVANAADGNKIDGYNLSYFEGMTLDRNTATGNARDGIVLAFGGGFDLQGNRATGNARHGIRLRDVAKGTLAGDAAAGNGSDGFHLMEGTAVSRLSWIVADGNGGWACFVDPTSRIRRTQANRGRDNTLGGSNVPGIVWLATGPAQARIANH